jgi:hypothetical protein
VTWYALVTRHNQGLMAGVRHRSESCGYRSRGDQGDGTTVIRLNPHSGLTQMLPVCRRCGIEKPPAPKGAWLDGVSLDSHDALARRK